MITLFRSFGRTLYIEEKMDATGDAENHPDRRCKAHGTTYLDYPKTCKARWPSGPRRVTQAKGCKKPIVCLKFRVSHQGNPGVGSNPTLVTFSLRNHPPILIFCCSENPFRVDNLSHLLSIRTPPADRAFIYAAQLDSQFAAVCPGEIPSAVYLKRAVDLRHWDSRGSTLIP
jgi:hypothetical protein